MVKKVDAFTLQNSANETFLFQVNFHWLQSKIHTTPFF